MSKKNTFESQLLTLEQIVHSLEKGNISLDEAMKQFEQGIKLARMCQKTLTDAQSKVANLLNTYDMNGLALSEIDND